jgi:hypothetical protein
MAPDGEDVIMSRRWQHFAVMLRGCSLTCFKLRGDHTGTSSFLTGILLQEPPLALTTMRDWLRMHFRDRSMQSYFVPFPGGMQVSKRSYSQ